MDDQIPLPIIKESVLNEFKFNRATQPLSFRQRPPHDPRYNTLSIEAKLWEGEPFLKNVKTYDREKDSTLNSEIGVEVSTRRRNKFAGSITKLEKNENVMNFELVVNEALGCAFNFLGKS